MLDTDKIKQDFPIFKKKINGKELVYLDSTATSLKPESVIDAVSNYYTYYSANVFRGIYRISETATEAYEKAREDVAKFINASASREIIFTRNASESLNLIYYSWARSNIMKGDEIVTTVLEHHSNFVPWQQYSQESGCKLKIWKTGIKEHFNIEDLDKLITRKTKLLAITALSNVTGLIVDIKEIARVAKAFNPGIKILVDGAQWVPHVKVDVSELNIDFLAFSGHKMLGPTGIGVLWGKKEILDGMPPFQFGGDMISEVHIDHTLFNSVPHKFEAGTPHIAGAIGLGKAVNYLNKIGMEHVRKHEKSLVKYAMEVLSGVKGLTVYGPEDPGIKGGVISFTLDKIHPHDMAQILDQDNICVRVGFHCAQPLHEFLGCGPTVRASFYIYNTEADIDKLAEGLERVKRIFK